jgi:hypothetical protein
MWRPFTSKNNTTAEEANDFGRASGPSEAIGPSQETTNE